MSGGAYQHVDRGQVVNAWAQVWRAARAGAYPLTFRGWLRIWADLIKASGLADFYLCRGQFDYRRQQW